MSVAIHPTVRCFEVGKASTDDNGALYMTEDIDNYSEYGSLRESQGLR